jgi:hypothetical protein
MMDEFIVLCLKGVRPKAAVGPVKEQIRMTDLTAHMSLNRSIAVRLLWSVSKVTP